MLLQDRSGGVESMQTLHWQAPRSSIHDTPPYSAAAFVAAPPQPPAAAGFAFCSGVGKKAATFGNGYSVTMSAATCAAVPHAVRLDAAEDPAEALSLASVTSPNPMLAEDSRDASWGDLMQLLGEV